MSECLRRPAGRRSWSLGPLMTTRTLMAIARTTMPPDNTGTARAWAAVVGLIGLAWQMRAVRSEG